MAAWLISQEKRMKRRVISVSAAGRAVFNGDFFQNRTHLLDKAWEQKERNQNAVCGFYLHFTMFRAWLKPAFQHLSGYLEKRLQSNSDKNTVTDGELV